MSLLAKESQKDSIFRKISQYPLEDWLDKINDANIQQFFNKKSLYEASDCILICSRFVYYENIKIKNFKIAAFIGLIWTMMISLISVTDVCK